MCPGCATGSAPSQSGAVVAWGSDPDRLLVGIALALSRPVSSSASRLCDRSPGGQPEHRCGAGSPWLIVARSDQGYRGWFPTARGRRLSGQTSSATGPSDVVGARAPCTKLSPPDVRDSRRYCSHGWLYTTGTLPIFHILDVCRGAYGGISAALLAGIWIVRWLSRA